MKTDLSAKGTDMHGPALNIMHIHLYFLNMFHIQRRSESSFDFTKMPSVGFMDCSESSFDFAKMPSVGFMDCLGSTGRGRQRRSESSFDFTKMPSVGSMDCLMWGPTLLY